MDIEEFEMKPDPRMGSASGDPTDPAEMLRYRHVVEQLPDALIPRSAGAVIGAVAVARDCTARHEAGKAPRDGPAAVGGRAS